MSSVRMCDKCGAIFSERESGWQTFQGNTIVRDPDGGNHAVRMQLDSCAECSTGGEDSEPIRPRLAAPRSETRVVEVRPGR